MGLLSSVAKTKTDQAPMSSTAPGSSSAATHAAAFAEVLGGETPRLSRDAAFSALMNGVGESDDKIIFLSAMQATQPGNFEAVLTSVEPAELQSGSLARFGYQPLAKGKMRFGLEPDDTTAYRGLIKDHEALLQASPSYQAAVKTVLGAGTLRVILNPETPSASMIASPSGAAAILINPALLQEPSGALTALVFEMMNVVQTPQFFAVRDKAVAGGYESRPHRGVAGASAMKHPDDHRRHPALSRRLDRLIAPAPANPAAARYAVAVDRVETRTAALCQQVSAEARAAGLPALNALSIDQDHAPASEGRILAAQALNGHTPNSAQRYELYQPAGGGFPTARAAALHRFVIEKASTGRVRRLADSIYADQAASPAELRAALQADLRDAISADPAASELATAEVENPGLDEGAITLAEARTAFAAIAVVSGPQRERMTAVVTDLLPELDVASARALPPRTADVAKRSDR